MARARGGRGPFASLAWTQEAEAFGRLHPVSLPSGYRVFESGRRCDSYVLVRSGRVRVHQLDADGHEVVLYRLGAGDTCILNTAAENGYAGWKAATRMSENCIGDC